MDRIYNPVFAGVPDSTLVALAQRGDNQAFTELIERHTPLAKRMAFSVLRDETNAEDEVQNAFWKAYEHIGQFQQDAKFSTWLSRIVVNECLMRLRKERRMRVMYLDDGLDGEETVTLDLPDQALTPESALAKTEIGAVLREEIRKIPTLLRDVFILREVQELSMDEVAGKLGITVAAAKSRLLRARQELRVRLHRHCGRQGAATLTA
ncbi:sigma-70 family RNA polymerase sigma factor [Paludibaculum fermentans]|uniref:Sigma-70 family RNA polymerase sigma factor n=1 Tax=Paludibaculum fermentans TaxID=1473598 RepID=A0A7S7NWF2_PALFE|nr:sigma-70 family RNA polymerase sigma factor [Paludibaculum fermentans]QOY91009.1 sigma-70 family RNA polymerase sigma factor [Paludibaculum fermentans]